MTYVTMTRMIALIWSLVLLAGVMPARAQNVTGASVTGRVTDPHQAAMANLEVLARHLEREQVWTTRTDDNGYFRFPALPLGRYEFIVSPEGFNPIVHPVTLGVGQALHLPLTLTLTGLAESVDVSAQVGLVDTTRTQLSENVTPADIQALPLNGRNYLDLALLTPGVSRHNTRNTERFAETSAVPGTQISIAGQRNLNNNYVLDGVSANDDAAGLAGTYLGQEVVREFQVVTSGGLAEFGRTSSGVINVITHSGTNAYRGAAYGFFRNDALDARNPFATRQEPLEQTQWGATLGGPLVKRRTFFFTNVEQTLNDRTVFVTIADPAVSAINARLDAIGASTPRVSNGGKPTGFDTTNMFGRVDHNLRSADRLAVRYNFYDIDSINARSVGALNDESRGANLFSRDHSLAATYTMLPSSVVVNEFRVQYNRSRLLAPAVDQIGPSTSISGVANFGTFVSSPEGRELDAVDVVDSLSFQRGRHMFKTGAEFHYNRAVVDFPGALGGSYTFTSLANFMIGRYANYQQAFGERIQAQTNPNLGMFAQTEFRWRDDVTINAGLRYDLQDLPDGVQTDTNNVSGRLGISYAPGDRRTVLRGSVGRYYDRIPLRAISNALQRDGVKYRVAVVPFGTAGAPAYPNVMTEFPAGLLTAVTTIDPDIETGESWQASLQVERELAGWMSASIGYMGVDGSQIIMSRNANAPTLSAAEAALLGIPNLGRPDPTIGNNSRYGSLGDSSYHGLLVSANTRGHRYAQMRLSYTLSKAIDTSGNAFFSSPQDNADIADEKGLSDNDQRHRLVVSGSVMVPEAPNGSAFRRVVANTQTSLIYTYNSASPYNIQTGADRNNDTTVNDRPAGVGRNTGVGFDFASLDLRVSRTVGLGGLRSIEFIAEAFNLLNRTNLLFPNNIWGTGSVPNASFGRATAAADPRQLQFGVRVKF